MISYCSLCARRLTYRDDIPVPAPAHNFCDTCLRAPYVASAWALSMWILSLGTSDTVDNETWCRRWWYYGDAREILTHGTLEIPLEIRP